MLTLSLMTPQDFAYIEKCYSFFAQFNLCTNPQEEVAEFVKLVQVFSTKPEGRNFLQRHYRFRLILQERIIYFIDECENHSLLDSKNQLESYYNILFTEMPTEMPTEMSTQVPTQVPTEVPTQVPTEMPTQVPTEVLLESYREVLTQVRAEEESSSDDFVVVGSLQKQDTSCTIS